MGEVLVLLPVVGVAPLMLQVMVVLQVVLILNVLRLFITISLKSS